MTNIRPIGSFFPLDASGHVVNPCSLPASESRLGQILAIATRHAQAVFSETLHSLWLRGSYARGSATPDSDLDLVLLVRDGRVGRWSEARGAETLRRELREQCGFTAPVEWMASYFTQDFLIRSPRLAMVLATQAVPVYGPDIRHELGRYTPGPAMRLYLDHWPADYRTFLESDPGDPAAVRAVTKAAIRSCFETVMTEVGQFTPDLFYGVAAFAERRPELSRVAWLILHHHVHPGRARDSLVRALRDIDAYLANEA